MGCCASKTSGEDISVIHKTTGNKHVVPRESTTTNSLVRRHRNMIVTPLAAQRAFSSKIEETSDIEQESLTEGSSIHSQDAETVSLLCDALSKSIVFTGMDKKHLKEAAGCMFLVEHAAGDMIIRQGAHIGQNDCLYYVLSGEVQILVSGGESGHIVQGPGWMFGDVALLFKGPRSASVAACTAATLWAMDLPALEKCVQYAPEARKLRFMRELPLLQGISDNQLVSLAPKVNTQRFSDGSVIIRKGDIGDRLFFIRRGRVSVQRPGENGQSMQLAVLGRGEIIGQRTLITGRVRTADCVAVGPVELLSILTEDFGEFSNPILTYVLDMDVIGAVQQGSKALGDLSELQLQQVIDKFETVTYSQGDVIFRSGDIVSSLYIVRNGDVVTTPSNATPLKEAGGFIYFGGVSTHHATMSVRVQSAQATLLVCDRQSWLRILDDQLDTTSIDSIGLKNLHTLQVVGSGSCGTVQLTRHIPSGTLYALKVVNKKFIEGTKQAQQILNERSVMQQINYQFCVKLYKCFGDDTNIYMLLEWMPGGELFHYLAERGCFDEETAKFYAACVLTGLEHMHSRGVIYRDLKPENLLLDSRGFLKITDFGFAKQTHDKKTFTMCGTPAYIAPEIIQHTGTTKSADWWSFGILIHEMLVGETPFDADDALNTYRRAIDGRFVLPDDISKPAADLIKKLLVVKPEKRLGTGPKGSETIKSHPWFKAFPWDALERLELSPPIVPNLDGPEDTRNFDL